MANTLLSIGMITQEALMVLENNLVFTKQVNRDYDDQFAKSGAKIGDTVNVRKPIRYVGRRGATLNVENSVESTVPVTLDTQWGVDVSFTSKELTLDLDMFSDRVLKPAIATVANSIDFDGMRQYLNIYNTVGTPGTTPTANSTYLDAGVKLDNEAAPRDGDRSVVVSAQAQATIVNNNTGLFNDAKTISEQYLNGTMGRALGFKWNMDQNVATHVVGPLGGTPLVNGVGQTGSTLLTDGWTAAAAPRLNRGDVFTIAGVFAVNPQNRTSTGQLRQFVVTSAAASDGSGNVSISISPAIVGPVSATLAAANQTVSALPADNAAITVLGTAGTSTPQNLAFHRNAFTLATADLEMPGGVDMAKRVSSKNLGISMRAVRAYDINNDRFPMRIDVLGGWATLRAELATRIAG